MQQILCVLFTLIYWRWMVDDMEIVRVLGWRTVRMRRPGMPAHRVTFLFWPFDI
jgi:hypothetical protein